MSAETMRWKNSRYNFVVSDRDRIALYNAASGSINILEGADAISLANYLCQSPRIVDVSELSSEFLAEMVTCGFLVYEDQDEVEAIANRFNEARTETPAVLTITTTQDCNLGCYYCYEKRLASTLGLADSAKIYEFTKSHII